MTWWGLLSAYLAVAIALRLLFDVVDPDSTEEGNAAAWTAVLLWLPILALVALAFVWPRPPRRRS